jgi:ferric-dicitrate binding protein FerR (iron transport regulator)
MMIESSEKRVQQLLETAIEQTCSDAECAELTRILEQHSENRRMTVAQLFVHSLLQWQSEDISKELGLPESAPGANAGLAIQSFDKRPIRYRRAWLWCAAAILICIAGFATQHAMRSSTISPDLVGEVAENHGVVWSDGCTSLKDGNGIVPGRLEIKSGTLTLRFRSGATVSATGAASMRIDSDMHVQLDDGQATAYVPQWAKGFTIETPDAKVVDLGTRFGVAARRDKQTDVVVFKGKVDVTPISGSSSAQIRLTQGEAARIDSEGAVSRIMEVHRDHRGEQWSTSEQNANESVFKSIHDNIKPSDSSKYYQITPRGLVDDALAYVDRPHEWNGLTEAGLPDFLQHADYVRTFNDYKYLNQLQINVQLSRPAMVYIFFDDRVPAPPWLKERFENTGVKIGLDEGPWPENDPTNPKLHTAVGPGVSIDNTFTVWRRRCDLPEELNLGAMGEQLGARAIYGIAGKPLE